jgi:hypothetical protein
MASYGNRALRGIIGLFFSHHRRLWRLRAPALAASNQALDEVGRFLDEPKKANLGPILTLISEPYRKSKAKRWRVFARK